MRLFSKTIGIVALFVVIATGAFADGIHNPAANSVGDFQGIDSNKASGAAPGLPLDGITTGIKAAYSTRQLLTAYAGNAMLIERASDSTTLNIGFTANVLNMAAINTFCAATICKVMTWFDQSGGGFNMTQATFAAAPDIFNAGVFVINSTRAALNWNRTQASILTNATLAQNPVNTLYINAVTAFSGGVASSWPIIGGTIGNNLEFRIDTSTSFEELLASVSASLGTGSVAQQSTGSVVELLYNSTTGAGSFFVDRAAAGTFTSTHTFAGGGAIEFGIDTNDTGSAATGLMGEVIMYDQVGGISTANRQAIENNQHTFWGTP